MTRPWFVRLIAVIGCGGAGGAAAHVTLEQPQAMADSYHKATLNVPHGCKGSATTAVRIRIPDGVTSVKPQPKPGWKLAITRVALPRPVDAGHGRMASDRISEVRWSGGSLADEHFDEFKIAMKLPDRPGATLYLPVVQECEQGVQRWTEVPDAARPGAVLRDPAPALKLLPKP